MKAFVVLTGIFLSFASMACSTYEAQFSSVVKEVTAVEGEPYACWIKLDINLSVGGQRYNPHMICPLDIEEVYEGRVYSRYCNFNPGDAISGYLVKLNGRIELE